MRSRERLSTSNTDPFSFLLFAAAGKKNFEGTSEGVGGGGGGGGGGELFPNNAFSYYERPIFPPIMLYAHLLLVSPIIHSQLPPTMLIIIMLTFLAIVVRFHLHNLKS